LVTLPKNCWPSVLSSVAIQLYAGECTPSVDRALNGVPRNTVDKRFCSYYNTSYFLLICCCLWWSHLTTTQKNLVWFVLLIF